MHAVRPKSADGVHKPKQKRAVAVRPKSAVVGGVRKPEQKRAVAS